MPDQPDPYPLLVLASAVFLVPFAIVALTSFIKISVVLFLVRSALGVQQTPPNLVLYAIALVLSAYVMTPVGVELERALSDPALKLADVGAMGKAMRAAAEPIRGFVGRFAEPEHRAFFLQATEQLWPPQVREGVQENDLIILIPAFIASELTRAFEIGVLLYLPFVVIDLIVTNILTAMGMLMVSPIVISLPFKLMLFVAVDGWTRLTHGLVLSYA